MITVRPGDGETGRLLAPDGGTRSPAPGAGRLGMTLFLLSLAVLFAGSLVGYAAVRARTPIAWRPAAEVTPAGLWLATLALAACSAALQRALAAIRCGRPEAMTRALLAGGSFALAFLGLQGWNWIVLWRQDVLRGPTLFGFTFFMLTGLHALHVAGGLVALATVLVRAWRGSYSWAYHPGLRHTVVYWHFLGGVWLVLLGVLVL